MLNFPPKELMNMKLQVSFDMTDLDKALEIASQIAPYTNIFEVGSLLLYKYGTKSIEQFRSRFSDKLIFADAKLIDRGKDTVNLLANAGADWITVMAGTSNHVIHSACTAAHTMNRKIMLDLLDASSLGQSALEAKSLGADALLFHESYDEQESLVFLEKWNLVRGNTNLPIFISGKITRSVIDQILTLKPDGIIIGKPITDAENPAEEAQFYFTKCNAD
jgi:3-keto-L-gulonate-6-phosphate decarboxylase